jgi:hypothetical protein
VREAVRQVLQSPAVVCGVLAPHQFQRGKVGLRHSLERLRKAIFLQHEGLS